MPGILHIGQTEQSTIILIALAILATVGINGMIVNSLLIPLLLNLLNILQQTVYYYYFQFTLGDITIIIIHKIIFNALVNRFL